MTYDFVRVCSVFVALWCCIPTSFGADVYKWTDASGTINYAAKPPANAKAVTLSPAASRLTIYQSNVREVESRVSAANAASASTQVIDSQRAHRYG